jgi:monovalent cation:H+ antiporter-2, CPA2 family
VVDQDRGLIEELRQRGISAFRGDVLQQGALKQMHLDTARLLVVAMSDPIATRHLVEEAHRQHPDLPIIARTHSESERKYLREHRVDAILAEQELAMTMSRHALETLGCAEPETEGEVRLQAV